MSRVHHAAVVTAVLAAGGAASGSAVAHQSAKPPKPGSVSLAAKPTVLVFGAATALSGRVGGAGAGVAIALQRDPYPFGDGFLPFRATATSNNGRFSFSITPAAHTQFRVVAATAPPATSPAVLVRVRMRVGLRLSTSTPRAGSFVRFSGSVHPAHDGRTASIQKRSPSGRWTTVARTTLQDAGTTRSAYSRRVRARSDGVYRVKVAGDADHLSGYSRTRTIDVR